MLKSQAMELILAEDGIRVEFQPIVEIGVQRGIHAYESLSRGPRQTHFETAPVLFEYIRLKHEEALIDRHCIEKAFAASAPLRPMTLNVNVHASTVEREARFADFVEAAAARSSVDLRNVVFEIVEQTPYWNARTLRGGVSRLRALGARVAVDDLGLGHCNYGMLIDVRPEYVKVDKLMIDGCASDPYRLALLRSIVLFSREVGTLVVAEGVEKSEDLEAVRSVGIPLAQGFLLGRPAPAAQHARQPILC